MRNITTLLVTFILLMSNYSNGQESIYETINKKRQGLSYSNEYSSDNSSFKIVLKHKEFAGAYYYYTVEVYVDGIEIKNYANDTILFGCGNEFEKEMKFKEIINFEGNPVGWVVDGVGSICGNTYSAKTYLILPTTNNHYRKFSIDNKNEIVINPIDTKNIEVWYYEQEWGKSGTSNSFFMPRKKLVTYKSNSKEQYVFNQGDILKNISKLNDFKNDYLYPTYSGLYYAGVQDLNTRLIQYSFDNYCIDNYKEYYKLHEIAATYNDIQNVCKVLIEKYDQ